MKRILMLLMVVAMMVVMLATSVAPAFAARPLYQCQNPNNTTQFATVYQGKYYNYYSGELGWTCLRVN